MRCLTLATALSDKYKASISFVCRAHDGHLANKIKQSGFDVFLLPKNSTFKAGNYPEHAAWLGDDWMTDADQSIGYLKKLGQQDWLIVDHYAIDARWHQKVRFFTKKIMVIDDLADRQLDCDLLLDQNLGAEDKSYNKCLLNKHAVTLLGAKFALLRPEFAKFRPEAIQRRRELIKPEKVLISLGGMDPDNVTGQVLNALQQLKGLALTVVMGSSAPHLSKIKHQCSKLSDANLIVDSSDMAYLMATHDICIGAAGSTSWERCCLGLPSIVFSTAQNQEKIVNLQQLNQVAIKLSIFDQQFNRTLLSVLDSLQNNCDFYKNIYKNAAKIADGKGAITVAKALSEVKA